MLAPPQRRSGESRAEVLGVTLETVPDDRRIAVTLINGRSFFNSPKRWRSRQRARRSPAVVAG